MWKSGLKLFGYIVPWWVLAVVLVLVIYILYDQGVFSKHLSNSNQMPERVISLPDSPVATGPGVDVLASQPIDSSPQLRNLLGRMYY